MSKGFDKWLATHLGDRSRFQLRQGAIADMAAAYEAGWEYGYAAAEHDWRDWQRAGSGRQPYESPSSHA